jgi:argininosuccinate lyase
LTAFSTSGCSSKRRQTWRWPALRIELPLDLQALAEAHLFDLQVALRQRDFFIQRDRLALVLERMPKQVAQVLQQASARAGSSRTSAIALLSVLNRKCGRMRACSSVSRAVVSAGVRALARQTSAATSMPGQQRTRQRPTGHPRHCAQVAGQRQQAAAIQPCQRTQQHTAHILRRVGQRASSFLALQAAISHTSVPGNAPPVSMATRASQSMKPTAPNIAPTPITHSTNSTARRITPVWQASNTSTRAGRFGATAAGSSWKVDKICESCIQQGNRGQNPIIVLPMSQNQFDKKSEAWSALFSEPMSDLVKRYTSSVFFDKRMWQADIAGSLAHAGMLAAQGIISQDDLASIPKGMAQITTEIESGAFEWKLDLEDVHLNIEARLTQLVGDAGKRLHTGRSRNDQVATDVRLWLRAEIDLIDGLLADLQKALVDIADQNVEVILPGFTHLQVAQPVSFGHHMLAYVEMFARDAERLGDVRRRVNRLPLGAAALAGTSYPLDREAVAIALGMVDDKGLPCVCQNSLDAVSDRDFAIEFTAAASLCMVHISRFSEELILWMSQNFGFIQIADRFTTGSSIMPQKKNPDVPELARGKTGRVVGHLMGLITLMKGQPLAYNKDNQEDKEPLFDTVDTLKDTLRIFAEMVGGITVKPEAMERAALRGYATATDLADYLVKKGLPFRDAHETVAHAVKAAISHNVDLSELPLTVLKEFNPAIEKDVYEALSLRGSLNARNTLGGTAPAQVRAQIARHRQRLG